ncbi:MAG TPA: pyridoxamine 5'-phosphate oxidase family protein [Candidatus Krumholzibacteria bacterium]|nr:pyridoxamine 5'-phosphate oxidase family protein [Candidatus Krumholzibacteria bacterium]
MTDVETAKLPAALRPVLDNGIPAVIVTCSTAGVPNATIISQVYYVDESHVALSFQFFNKTIRNVRENPRAAVMLADVAAAANWVLALEFERSEKAGPIFEAMDIHIEAIASSTGMSGIFKLQAADVYRVRSVRHVPFHP